MTKVTLIKENIYLGLTYTVRGLAHYHHDSMQADMEKEKELSFYILISMQQGRNCLPTGKSLSLRALKLCSHSDTPPLTRPHPLQQAHISYSIPCQPSIHTYESMGPNLFKPH